MGTHVSGPRYSQLIMETSDTESDLEVIPMKRCSGQRSKSLPFNTLRTSTTGSAPNVGNLLLQGAGHQPPTTLKEGLQFLETSRNEIIYKTKKVEYILEKEKRARRGSQDINKMARLKAWLMTKINGNKNLKAADETLLQANETLKGVAEMIYKMDDTMTQEEENLCQR